MAERRMFAKTIIDSDAFLEMPISSQVLYFHLAMRADDDGFINKPKTIIRMVGCKDDDMRLLIERKFVIPFDSGVVVIKHWKIHNYIRKDTYSETKYKDEKSKLFIDKNGSYKAVEQSMSVNCNEPVTNPLHHCNEPVTGTSTQVRLGKDRLGKDRLDNKKEETRAKEIKKIVEAYENSIGMIPQHILSAALSFLDDGIESDLISRAIQISAENNVRKWNYAAAILKDCQNKGIKTLSAFEAEKRKNEPKIPKETNEEFKGKIYAPPAEPILIDPNKPFDINDYLPGD